MSRFTGRADRVVFGVALCLAACANEPDASLDVSRMSTRGVNVKLCSGDPPACGLNFDPLFKANEPESVVRAVAIHLDEAVDRLTVQFQQTALSIEDSAVCHYVVVPFDDSPRSFTVILPMDNALADVRGCDDCIPQVCGP